MAVWVPLARAMKFPEIERVYKKAGRGQGTGQAAPGLNPGSSLLLSAPRGFLATVKRFVNESNGASLPAWIRKMPGVGGLNQWQTVQIDVTAIPGVRKLRKDGKWTSAS